MSIYRITIKARHSTSGAMYNIHHYEFPGYVPEQTEAEEMLQGLVDIMEEEWLTYVSDDVVFSEVEYRRVDIGDQPTAVFVPAGWPINGSDVNNCLPHQVAAVMRWVGDTEYPRSARAYLPVFGADALSAAGLISLTVQTALNGAAPLYEEIPVTGQVDAQKVAVQYGGDPRVVTAANIVSARNVDPSWGIQRRRRAGRGI